MNTESDSSNKSRCLPVRKMIEVYDSIASTCKSHSSKTRLWKLADCAMKSRAFLGYGAILQSARNKEKGRAGGGHKQGVPNSLLISLCAHYSLESSMLAMYSSRTGPLTVITAA